MPEGGAAAEAKLFEKVTARKEPQQRRKSTGAKTAGGAARSAAKTAAKKEDPKTAGRKKEKAAPEKKGASKTAAETKKATQKQLTHRMETTHPTTLPLTFWSHPMRMTIPRMTPTNPRAIEEASRTSASSILRIS